MFHRRRRIITKVGDKIRNDIDESLGNREREKGRERERERVSVDLQEGLLSQHVSFLS